MQKGVTARDMGLAPARAAQGRAAEQRHNISCSLWCLAEDGHLKHILVPRGRRRKMAGRERAGFAPSTVPGVRDG